VNAMTTLVQAAADAAPVTVPTPQPMAPPEIQAFLLMEAMLLDARRLEEWLALYTADCVYWMPAEEGQAEAESRISLCYDDRRIMEDRIWRLRHPKMFSQTPPARQVRLVSNMVMGADATAERPVVESSFIMFEHRLREQRLFGGRTEHVLVRTADGLRIARKTVRLANCDAPLWNIGVPL